MEEGKIGKRKEKSVLGPNPRSFCHEGAKHSRGQITRFFLFLKFLYILRDI